MIRYTFLCLFLFSSMAFTAYSISLLHRKPDPSNNGSLRKACKVLVFMDLSSLIGVCYIIVVGYCMGDIEHVIQNHGEFFVCFFLFGSCVLSVAGAVFIPFVILYFGYTRRSVRQELGTLSTNQSISTRVSPDHG